MYYIVEKSGMFLVDSTPWSSTWLLAETEARKFWSKDHAAEVAEKNDGTVLSRSLPN